MSSYKYEPEQGKTRYFDTERFNELIESYFKEHNITDYHTMKNLVAVHFVANALAREINKRKLTISEKTEKELMIHLLCEYFSSCKS